MGVGSRLRRDHSLKSVGEKGRHARPPARGFAARLTETLAPVASRNASREANRLVPPALGGCSVQACPSPSTPEGIHITISIIKNTLNIKVFDEGAGFDPEKLPPPDFKGEREGGRGFYLINSVMDKVIYRKHKNGYVLEMIKRLN